MIRYRQSYHRTLADFAVDRHGIVFFIEKTKTLYYIAQTYSPVLCRIFNILTEILKSFGIHTGSVIFDGYLKPVSHAFDIYFHISRFHLTFDEGKIIAADLLFAQQLVQ